MPFISKLISKYRLQRMLLVLFPLALLLSAADGICVAADAVGKLTSVTGKVDLLRGGRLPAVKARVGDSVFVKDFVRTKSNSRAEIRFNDGNLLRVAPRSRMDISEYAVGRDRRSFRLSRGRVEAIASAGTAASKTPRRFEITTPNAVAGVRGTWFFVFFDSNATGVAVKEGTVYAYNSEHPENVIDISAGFATLIRNGDAPQPLRPATDAELTIIGNLGSGGQFAGFGLPAGGVAPPAYLAQLSSSNDTRPVIVVNPVEVGMANFTYVSGGPPYFNAAMNNVHFYSTAWGATPVFWKTDSVTVTGVGGAPTAGVSSVQLTSGIGSVNMSFNTWNTATGAWSASLTNGTGNLNGTFRFSGNASGSGAFAAGFNTATGTAAGSASK